MEVEELFEYIAANEGLNLDDVAKLLGVSRSTLYYSIGKNKLSKKLRKAIQNKLPQYLELIKVDESEEIRENDELKYVAEFVVNNEERLLDNSSTFRLWLKTKVQEGVIKILSDKK